MSGVSSFLESMKRPVRFTAGDLIEGLSYLEPIQRRAVLFGLEQQLALEQVIDMTHAEAAKLPLTPIGQAIVAQSPRHLRLAYLFWEETEDGMITPLFTLAVDFQNAFFGLSWDAMLALYRKMVWVDQEVEMDHFMRTARELGLSI